MNYKNSCFMTTLSLILSTASCNSRPTYDIFVYEFESNCGGETYLKIEHDPEPEAPTVKIEPEFIATAQAAGVTFEEAGHSILVHFESGIECSVDPLGMNTGHCHIVATKAPANCDTRFYLYSMRYPSRGPGFNEPYARFPGDERLQSDIIRESDDRNAAEKSTTK
jgi:hypothetical protein